MKKYVLFLGLGLGLLVTEDGFCTKVNHPCNANGNCYIRNAVSHQMFFFNKDKELIGDLDGSAVNALPVPDDSFPIYASPIRVFKPGNAVEIKDAHCYIVWPGVRVEYYTTRYGCGL